MSNLIELLTNTEINIKNNKKIKPSQNFIMQLLKDSEPKKAIDLLKELQLSKEDIKKFILKLPKKEQQAYLELLKNLKTDLPISKDSKTTSSNLKKSQTDLPIFEDSKTNSSNFNSKTNLPNFKDSKATYISNETNKKIIKHQKSNLNSLSKSDFITKKNQNEKEEKTDNIKELKTENIKLENILHLFTNKSNFESNKSNFKTKTENLKQTKLKLIKKEIEINFRKNKNLQNQKVTTQIKNASSIEELINIANKNDLNIKKIILKTIDSNTIHTRTTPTQINPVKNNKIAKNNKLKNVKIKTNHFKNKPSNLIQTILKQKVSTQKNIKHKIDNINNTHISIIQSNEKSLLKTLLSKNQKEDNQTSNTLNLTNIHTEIKQKIITAKESIKHFSNRLKEAIENYKPPVSKLSLELHPKELGKVEVTIIHRGDNLQININSNNQAINFFHINQTELKNTLINLGYNGVDMSFNSNQQNKEKAHKQYSSHKKKEDDYDELVIEIPYQYA